MNSEVGSNKRFRATSDKDIDREDITEDKSLSDHNINEDKNDGSMCVCKSSAWHTVYLKDSSIVVTDCAMIASQCAMQQVCAEVPRFSFLLHAVASAAASKKWKKILLKMKDDALPSLCFEQDDGEVYYKSDI